MKGTYLGEFEELVLLAVCVCYDEAYGVAVQEEIEKQTGRSASLSAIHTVLYRLQKKGYLRSRMGGATSERGGRAGLNTSLHLAEILPGKIYICNLILLISKSEHHIPVSPLSLRYRVGRAKHEIGIRLFQTSPGDGYLPTCVIDPKVACQGLGVVDPEL